MDLYYTLLLSWPKHSIVVSTIIHALNSALTFRNYEPRKSISSSTAFSSDYLLMAVIMFFEPFCIQNTAVECGSFNLELF